RDLAVTGGGEGALHRIVGGVRQLLVRRGDLELEDALVEVRDGWRGEAELAVALRRLRREAETSLLVLVADLDHVVEELDVGLVELDLELLRLVAELVDEAVLHRALAVGLDGWGKVDLRRALASIGLRRDGERRLGDLETDGDVIATGWGRIGGWIGGDAGGR